MAQNEFVKREEFVEQFAEMMGKERAYTLFIEATRDAGCSEKDEFNRDEVLRICEALKSKDALLSIFASCLINRYFGRKKEK